MKICNVAISILAVLTVAKAVDRATEVERLADQKTKTWRSGSGYEAAESCQVGEERYTFGSNFKVEHSVCKDKKWQKPTPSNWKLLEPTPADWQVEMFGQKFRVYYTPSSATSLESMKLQGIPTDKGPTPTTIKFYSVKKNG